MYLSICLSTVYGDTNYWCWTSLIHGPRHGQRVHMVVAQTSSPTPKKTNTR